MLLKTGRESSNIILHISFAKRSYFLWCIVTELSLMRNSPNDEDLPFHE